MSIQAPQKMLRPNEDPMGAHVQEVSCKHNSEPLSPLIPTLVVSEECSFKMLNPVMMIGLSFRMAIHSMW